jgi:hypothetical protein
MRPKLKVQPKTEMDDATPLWYTSKMPYRKGHSLTIPEWAELSNLW